MGNWQKMMRARAQNGSFVGRGRNDEDAYFEFFAGANRERGDLQEIVPARPIVQTYLRAFSIVHFGTRPKSCSNDTYDLEGSIQTSKRNWPCWTRTLLTQTRPRFLKLLKQTYAAILQKIRTRSPNIGCKTNA